MGKRENVGYQHFLVFPLFFFFSIAIFLRVVKDGLPSKSKLRGNRIKMAYEQHRMIGHRLYGWKKASALSSVFSALVVCERKALICLG